MRSIVVTFLLMVVAVTGAPERERERNKRQVVVTPDNYPSLLYINSASGLSRVKNTSGSPIFELILYPANPSPPAPVRAMVVLGGGSAQGTIVLTQDKPPTGDVLFQGVITNLTAGWHGFHVHDKGNLEGGCVSAKGHYNPYMRNHGSPNHLERHVGDLGNIYADQNGIAHVNITDPLVTLVGPRSVIGRAIVVHAGVDDLGTGNHPSSLTTGNAGGRVACGVIGLA